MFGNPIAPIRARLTITSLLLLGGAAQAEEEYPSVSVLPDGRTATAYVA